MLSFRLLADSDRACYRKCDALSNMCQSAPMQTSMKDMSTPPQFYNTAAKLYLSSIIIPN